MKTMSKIVTIVGGAMGAVAFLAMVIGFIWFCKSQNKNFSNRTSDTGSSDPSARAGFSSLGTQGGRFTIEELQQATKQFNESSLIGHGSFGSVYKGLLRDTVVAIKRRQAAPRQEFVAEVIYLSEIHHRNVVTLLGYCQENGSQMLVYEYIPNGSMCNHLYDSRMESSTRIEFKQRLSIALGAAKGLCHLHGLKPPLVHRNFKTANVMVDENFIAKVADAGISNLVQRMEEAGPSRTSSVTVFQDPEVEASGTFTEMSDVYSFGVFLLELITGQEAVHINSLGSNESLIQWVRSRLSSNNFVDHRLAGSFTMEGIRDLIRLTLKCMTFPGKNRPKMEKVVHELEQIHEKEMALTTVMGEGTATITLGSELFASK
ncbi:proline-rich receptor-like protein kinase PERK3 [Durio zibethinus]|uniref:non-specific serine/threonine protein kinase n=1 Tax=Durio zibethinus TaxID=66656 RepID=A0A6P5Z3A8_DURZI|nr:proline-rich receptor-like protein kinase PERK3 [Durio zibethinus]XP_022747051.1 proline-rich receptor-like protein kinase PERK3 [Durio zibethinus]XP_022747052.1 proline-rich receptor-like protein kinase PERK3 [Durio zibethinus]XP_022747053.1 proline-rich receptor-like protein kinase PERK3 [Durio zibethinus]